MTRRWLLIENVYFAVSDLRKRRLSSLHSVDENAQYENKLSSISKYEESINDIAENVISFLQKG